MVIIGNNVLLKVVQVRLDAKELHNFEKFGVVTPVKFVGQKVINSNLANLDKRK